MPSVRYAPINTRLSSDVQTADFVLRVRLSFGFLEAESPLQEAPCGPRCAKTCSTP